MSEIDPNWFLDGCITKICGDGDVSCNFFFGVTTENKIHILMSMIWFKMVQKELKAYAKTVYLFPSWSHSFQLSIWSWSSGWISVHVAFILLAFEASPKTSAIHWYRSGKSFADVSFDSEPHGFRTHCSWICVLICAAIVSFFCIFHLEMIEIWRKRKGKVV